MSASSGFASRGGRALRRRNFRLFFAGQLVSVTGTWIQQVAQGWLVLELTDDPFMLGLVAAAQFSPVVILGLIGGLLADNLSKRTVLVVAQVVQMGLAVVLFALTQAGQVQIWQVIALAALLGTTQAIEWPARHSFIVELVGRDDLVNAIGINSATFNLARMVGPAAAGLIIAVAGIPLTFLVNAITYLPVILALLAIRDAELFRPPVQARPASLGEVRRALADGPRFVAREPMVRMAIVVLGVVATFGMNFPVTIPPLARDVLGLDATGFGFLMAASGAGSLGAAMAVIFARRIEPRMVALAALVLGLATVVLAVSRSFPVSIVAMTVAGAGAIGMAATGNTFIQLAVPDALRGRVMSVWTMVFSASVPIGGLVMGAIAARAGVALALGIGGVVSTAAAVIALAWYRQRSDGRGQQVQPPTAGRRGD